MDDFVIHLRAWLCLVTLTICVVAATWYADRRRDPGDTRGWKSTEAHVLGRVVVRERPDQERLTVGFQTWRGHPALLVADVPTAQAPPTDRVWVLYDPLHPERAQLTLDQPDDA